MNITRVKCILMTGKFTFAVSLVLAALFTSVFLFLTLEIPLRVNYVLRAYFPDLGFHTDLIETFLSNVRPVGYACLAAVFLLAVTGLAAGGRLASLGFLGSLAFFLPVFGYFAFSMFFLAGVGILRVLWMPLLDLSPDLLRLGDIVYLPALAVLSLLRLFGVDARVPLSVLFMGLGLSIFFLGGFTWIFGRAEGRRIIDFWIYKCSRHPQYLGFLLWSYGTMLLATFAPFPKGGYFPEPSFPWLISALTVISTALLEEIEMVRKHGGDYLKYRSKAPFMLPIPEVLSRAVTAPFRILTGKELPERRQEVLYAFLIYCIVLLALSLPFLTLKLR